MTSASAGICGRCWHPMRAGARFCTVCGAPAAVGAPAAPATRAIAAKPGKRPGGIFGIPRKIKFVFWIVIAAMIFSRFAHQPNVAPNAVTNLPSDWSAPSSPPYWGGKTQSVIGTGAGSTVSVDTILPGPNGPYGAHGVLVHGHVFAPGTNFVEFVGYVLDAADRPLPADPPYSSANGEVAIGRAIMLSDYQTPASFDLFIPDAALNHATGAMLKLAPVLFDRTGREIARGPAVNFFYSPPGK